MAGQGLRVTALEAAATARAKAADLAAARGVTVDWIAADLRDYIWPEAGFDAVLGCFIQFAPPAFRAGIFAGLARALRPGGLLFLHGFARRQIHYGTGGPDAVDQLYSLDLLRAAFADWPVLHQADYDSTLTEGAGHSGRAALIDFVARKPG